VGQGFVVLQIVP